MAEIMLSDEQQKRLLKASAAADLTPSLLKALLSLTPGAAAPMNALAKRWRCDNSWVTGLVDGLEERGYAQRRGLVADRRVKMVEITESGEKAIAAALDCLYDPPSSITRLDRKDQEALRNLIRELRDECGF